MRRALDLLIFQASRLGRIGGLGLVLLIAALVADFVVLQPKQAELDALVVRNVRSATTQPMDRSGQRAANMEMPVATAAEEVLRHLFAAAAKNGLVLDQGDYSLSSEKDGMLHRYQISLPVYGTYPALRAFIAQALNEEPALALSHLQMERGAIEETELAANLRFTLFLKEAR